MLVPYFHSVKLLYPILFMMLTANVDVMLACFWRISLSLSRWSCWLTETHLDQISFSKLMISDIAAISIINELKLTAKINSGNCSAPLYMKQPKLWIFFKDSPPCSAATVAPGSWNIWVYLSIMNRIHPLDWMYELHRFSLIELVSGHSWKCGPGVCEPDT